MKGSLALIILIIFLITINVHQVDARNKNTMIPQRDTDTILIKEIDQPLEQKEKEIKKLLNLMDITVGGFTKEKEYKTLPPATLRKFIKKKDELKEKYEDELYLLLEILSEELTELKSDFELQGQHYNNKLLLEQSKILRNKVQEKLNRFNEKIQEINLKYDKQRDEIIKDIEKQNTNKRRRRRNR